MNLFHPTTAVTLGLLLSVLIPGVSSLLSRQHWPSEVMGLLTAALAALTGFLTVWQSSSNSTHYDWKTAAEVAVSSYVIAALARQQFWAGTRTDAKLLQFPAPKADQPAQPAAAA